MKKITIICVCMLVSIAMQAGTGINKDNNNSGASASSGTNYAITESLVPAMTIIKRNAIINPETGMLVLCTDNNQYYINKGTPENPKWMIKHRPLPTREADFFESWHRFSEDSKPNNGC